MEEQLQKIFNEIADQKEPIMVITKQGIMVNGGEVEVMNMISLMIDSLIKQGFPERLIKGAVITGLMSEDEAKKAIEEIKRSDGIDELLEKIKEIMERY